MILQTWLVVEPTHLKFYELKLGSSSPISGVKIKHIWNHTPSSRIVDFDDNIHHNYPQYFQKNQENQPPPPTQGMFEKTTP